MAKPVIQYNAGKLQSIPAGTNTQVLTIDNSGDPSWASVPYDIASMVVGTPTAGAIVMSLPAVRAYTISSTNTDHLFRAATNVSGVLTVKNGVNTVFTATWNGTSTNAVISAPANTSVAVSSNLTIEVTTLGTLADLYWNIKAVTP